MALRLCSRSVSSAMRQPLRAMSVYKGGVPTKDEAATGKERVQLEAFKAGVTDPWDREQHTLQDYEEGTGMSQDKAVPVFSSLDRRIVCCSCDRSNHLNNHMWLYKGEPKRCPCGIWFQLHYRDPPHVIWTPEEMKLDSGPADRIEGI